MPNENYSILLTFGLLMALTFDQRAKASSQNTIVCLFEERIFQRYKPFRKLRLSQLRFVRHRHEDRKLYYWSHYVVFQVTVRLDFVEKKVKFKIWFTFIPLYTFGLPTADLDCFLPYPLVDMNLIISIL